MATVIDGAEACFATSVTNRTRAPRWQRKALEASRTTPKRKASDSDRFIPDRANMDMDACKFNLARSEAENGGEATASPSKLAYQRQIKANFFDDDSNAKILSLKQSAPKPRAGHQSDLAALYSQSRDTVARKPKKSLRHIPQTPDRILDAPELRPDFYLNLVEWSTKNTIAVALGQAVYLWDAGSGGINQLPFDLTDPNDYVSSVSWVNDGRYLAVGTAESKVQVWDVTAEKKIRTINTNSGGRIAAMDWNQHILSTGTVGGSIFNHDVRVQDHHIQTLSGHGLEVCGLKWSSDGKYLASGANDNVVNVWNEAGNQHCAPRTEHTAAVKALAWCPWQSNLLATGGGTADRKIRFWNVNTGACVNRLDTHSQVSSLCWSKEHREIISGHGYAENQLSIWSYPTLSKVADLTGHTERILSMSMSPDGSTVVSAAADETLRFWKCFASDGKQKKKSRVAAQTGGRLSQTLR